jgi:hypothetical protein
MIASLANKKTGKEAEDSNCGPILRCSPGDCLANKQI